MKKNSSLAFLLAFLVFSVPVMAQKTFYFLPPYEPEWMRKAPRIIDIDAGEDITMKIAPELCGWYKATIESGQLGHELIIWQGKVDWNTYDKNKTTDRLGVRGQDEASDEWKGTSPPLPEAIVFNNISQASGSAVYFNPSIGMAGWSATLPAYNTIKYCQYRMAGLIYDTHSSLLTSFSHESTEGTTGIKKGIVKPTLVRNAQGIQKMEFNQPKNEWANAIEFNQAFNCTGGKNAMVCYDMPFKKDSKGLWTFDSDYLCNDGTIDLDKPVASRCASNTGSTYGFFPNRLNGSQSGIDDNPPLNASCTYSNCPTCATAVQAESWVPLNNTISRNCYEYGLSGTGSTKAVCGSAFGEGQFTDGNPNIWDRGWSRPTLEPKNEYFCFESHATFIYEKGQEFFFGGNDDIWVFIDNNLVIDLGGSHLAAPGYVALDSIGRPGRWQGPAAVSGNALSGNNYTPLVEGGEYNIDIFFCNRRSNMSTLRISTNISVVQETGILYKPGGNKDPAKTVELCVMKSGAGSCESLLGTGGTGTQTMCGSAVDGIFEFYLQRRGSSDPPETLRADPDRCLNLGNKKLLCYGGITIDMSNGSFSINKNNVTLSGIWYLFAQVNVNSPKWTGEPPYPMLVATIQKLGAVRMAWGEIREFSASGENLLQGKGVTCSKEINAPTGQLVPVCFSVGDIQGNRFITEDYVAPQTGSAGIGGMPFMLNKAGFGKMKVYRDKEGTVEVTNLNETFYIPTRPNGSMPPTYSSGPGVLVLWVTGDYEGYYKINVSGRQASEEVTLTTTVSNLRVHSKTANANAMQPIKNGISLQVAKNTSLEIFSLNGKLIRRMDFASGVYSVEFSNLPKGIYIAKAKFENSKIETMKIPVM